MYAPNHKTLRQIESLEARRVLAAPTVGGLSVLPSTPQLGEPLTVTAMNVSDADGDVERVQFFVDNGDGVFNAQDKLIGTDTNAANGWQLTFPTSSPYRILPLGDSITQPSGQYQSYRYPLWQELVDAGYGFDFVGTQSTNRNGNIPSYPNYQGQSFDLNHEGHSGWKADQVLDALPGWLQTYTPDIVLIHLGTNDVLAAQSTQSTISELGQIINVLRQDNPNVMVLVAQLIPATNSATDARVDELNAAIPGAVAVWNTPQSPVVVVDQNTGFSAATHTYDGIHPNAAGEQLMADAWAEAITANRPLANPSAAFPAGVTKIFAVAMDQSSNYSNAAVATFDLGGSSQNSTLFPTTEFTRYGTASGSLNLLRDSDNIYQVLTEQSYGGSTHRLTQEWQFNIPAGSTATLAVEAFRSNISETFYVNYSTDRNNWSNMFALGKTSDDNQVQTRAFPAGISGTVWVRIKDDNAFADSSDETVYVDYLGVTLEGVTEPTPVVTIASTGDASESGLTAGGFTFSRTGSTSQPLTVSYNRSGTATNGTDYQSLSGNIVIPAGSSQATLQVVPINDTAVEGTETVQLTLSGNASYQIGAASLATINLLDDDNPLPFVSVERVRDGVEGGQSGQIRLVRTGSTSAPLTVRYSTGGNATSGSDYAALSGAILIPALSGEVLLNVAPIDDTAVEGPETFTLSLLADTNYQLGIAGEATLQIQDNDAVASNRAYPISQNPRFGTASALSNLMASDNAYQVLTEDANDYLMNTYEFNLPSNTGATVRFEGYSSTSSEGFWINFSTDNKSYRNMMTVRNTTDTNQPQSYVLPAGTSGKLYVMVRDTVRTLGVADQLRIDELYVELDGGTTPPPPPPPSLPTITIAASDATANESGDTGRFQISRTGSISAALNVGLQWSGTATRGTDYTSTPTTITIPAGASTVNVDIVPIDDASIEGNETAIVTVANNSAYMIGSASNATVTIGDNDSAPTVFGTAIGERTRNGNIATGSFADTFANDGVYEVLQETAGAGGRLDHTWEFDVATLSQLTISMQAHSTSTSEVFWVNYSTDNGNNYRNLLTISKNADNNVSQTRVFPTLVSGKVLIQVRDSDRASSDAFADQLFVDELKLVMS